MLGDFQHPDPTEIEQCLIGCLLLDPARLDAVADIVQIDDFRTPHHRVIFEAITQACQVQRDPDVSYLCTILDNDPLFDRSGGARAYLAGCASAVATPANALDYAQQVHEFAQCRQLADLAQSIYADAMTRSPDRSASKKIEEAEEALYRIGSANQAATAAIPIIHAIDAALKDIELAQKGFCPAIKTGIDGLDQMLGGLFPSELTIIAGRPSMGKTALGMTVACNAAKAGHAGMFFSLEMSKKQLAARYLARSTDISVDEQRKGNLTDEQWLRLSRARLEYQKLPLYIDDKAGLSVGQIRTRTRRQIRTTGLKFVVVDYLSKIHRPKSSESTTYQYEKILTALKDMAKDFDIPVILLAQINRGVEERDDKRPLMSDLKDSGSIEQEADNILLLYREEYYLSRSQPVRKSGEVESAFNARLKTWDDQLVASKGKADVFVPKFRQGADGQVTLNFDGRRQLFNDLEQSAGFHYSRGQG